MEIQAWHWRGSQTPPWLRFPPSWYRPFESIDPSAGGIPRKVRAFDTQLAKLLGDPRKPKTGPSPGKPGEKVGWIRLGTRLEIGDIFTVSFYVFLGCVQSCCFPKTTHYFKYRYFQPQIYQSNNHLSFQSLGGITSYSSFQKVRYFHTVRAGTPDQNPVKWYSPEN